ncbi:MAG: hypothetical protein ACKO1N_09355 [Erythrobacter sp.]
MNRAALLALVLAPYLALVACGDEAVDPAKQDKAAAGEVLPGSISDAMIPLEQLNSQAPLAPRQTQSLGEDIDAEQPDVTPMGGINTAPPTNPGANAGADDGAADDPAE